MNRHERLIKELNLLKRKQGITEAFIERCYSFYALLELSLEELMEFLTVEETVNADTTKDESEE